MRRTAIIRRVLKGVTGIAVKHGFLKPTSSIYFNIKYLGLQKCRTFPFEDVLNFVRKSVPIERLDKWVDLGCGFGEFPGLIKKRYPHLAVSGLDFSTVAISKAISEYPQCSFQTKSVYNTESPDNYFNIVSILETLEHLENPKKALEEIFRILKPLGYLVITVPFKGKTSSEHIHSFNQERLLSLLPVQPTLVHFGFTKTKFDKIIIGLLQKEQGNR